MRACLCRDSELGHVADLGDEHRGQHRADPGNLLQREKGPETPDLDNPEQFARNLDKTWNFFRMDGWAAPGTGTLYG